MAADGRITHDSVGRINVERGDGSVTLRLWQWSLKPDATLTHAEAQQLMKKIERAMAPPRERALAVEENHEDLA